jgi:hypothetical protein
VLLEIKSIYMLRIVSDLKKSMSFENIDVEASSN